MLLNRDGALHMRVQRTKIGVVAGCRERERVAVVGIERFRPELARGDDGVGNVVAVLPGHGGADLHGKLCRLKGEIVDHDRQFLAARAGDLRGHHGSHREADAKAAQGCVTHDPALQPCSGVSMMASRSLPALKSMVAMPSRLRSRSSATFIGPGEGAVPGAGCGKAVERAAWKVPVPSTFCIT